MGLEVGSCSGAGTDHQALPATKGPCKSGAFFEGFWGAIVGLLVLAALGVAYSRRGSGVVVANQIRHLGCWEFEGLGRQVFVWLMQTLNPKP